ncbi:MAG TPA: amidase [Alphaproteobacteria bacterium]|nr:amidase [Alphaproteobacteria bacterium]
MKTLLELSTALASGATTSRALTEAALAIADDKAGEGARIFTRLYRERALAEADASDRLRKLGVVPSPLAGLPISIKDLFDVAGETTLAGSVVLKGRPAAKADAPIVARLRAAGAVIIGRTNMTEFAFSGLGLNPHYGTPLNPWDRKTRRIPGGSSSGAGVSVAEGMAAAAIGTDTGGSIRIPSALCGVTGLKPTAKRVPTEGCFPLSQTLDSIGPLAPSVACCALVDAVLSGAPPQVPAALPLAGLRLGAPQRFMLDGMDKTVSDAYGAALTRLSKAGARIVEIPFGELETLPAINAKGGIVTAEAYAIHRKLIAEAGERYDPRVGGRIKRGSAQDAADYVDLLAARRDLIARAAAISAPFDALIMPTVPVVAPALAPLEADDDLYTKTNVLVLRNPSAWNFLDRCALSLPCHAPGEAPVGLMLVGEHGGDRRLVSVGLAVEATLRR